MENKTFDYEGLCGELKEALKALGTNVTVSFNPNPGTINVFKKDGTFGPWHEPAYCSLLVRKFDRNRGSQLTDQQREIEELKGEVRGLQMRSEELEAESSKKDKMIKSLYNYIEVLQKSRTPVVFTATKEELKDVQEFIAKHVL